MKTLLLAAVAAASLCFPLPGQAADTVVSLADLNLASPAGHDEAMLRISRAAFRVCREIPVEGVGQLQDWLNYLDCARAAAETAAAQLPPVRSDR
ncbi:MAG TPA: UrcA family protein [Myxococcaceae bacterium]|nr:UrcA family protein [Myxococcaceae bacterium]